jgi:hypothetical protein
MDLSAMGFGLELMIWNDRMIKRMLSVRCI